MSAFLHSPWSGAIGLVVVAAWILFLCAIFWPGKDGGKRDDVDGWL